MGAHKRGNSRKVGLNCDGNDSVIEDNSASGSSMRQPDIPTNAADNLSVGAVSMGAFTVENIMTPTKSRRPKDNAFMQQRISCWIMLLTPKVVITFFLFSSVTCIIVGVLMKNKVRGVYETSIIYEGTDSSINGCEISVRGENSTCNVTLVSSGDMEPPIYVYYGLTNFYQNTRKYFASRDSDQLLGRSIDANLCVNENPCGLIAASTFNDTFELIDLGNGEPVDSDTMSDTGIAWEIDRTKRFKQPRDFTRTPCADGVTNPATCEICLLSPDFEPGCFTAEFQDQWYAVYYPDNDRITYLYEMFDFVNPVEGVENEHFMIWMRTAGKSSIKKVYGVINQPIAIGQTLTFAVNANFFVKDFHGEKTLSISTLSSLGSKNNVLWIFYIFMGAMCAIAFFFFIAMNVMYGRDLADTRYLDLRFMM